MLFRSSSLVIKINLIAFFALGYPCEVLAESVYKLLSQGEAFYLEGSFNEASDTLKAALRKSKTNKNRAKAHLLIGMVHLAQDKLKQAQEAFGRAIRLDPKRKLSTNLYPPNVVNLYNRSRVRFLGSLNVQTSPSDAKVYINGKSAGMTPIVVEDILVGDYKIKIVRKDYRPEERKITIHSSELKELFLKLTALDKLPPKIDHTPTTTIFAENDFRVESLVKDNRGVTGVLLNFRKSGDTKYETVEMEQTKKDLYKAIVPQNKIFLEGLEYFISAVDAGGNKNSKGGAADPFKVRVVRPDSEPPRITHAPMTEISEVSKLFIEARVTDNKGLANVKLHYKRGDEKEYMEEEMVHEKGTDNFSAMISEAFMNASRIDYYMEAVDEAGNVRHAGRQEAPISVKICKVLPFKEGYIIDRKKDKRGRLTNEVIVNVGNNKGVGTGQIFTVVKADERLVDPETGMVLSTKQVLVGKIKITIPESATSEAKIIREFGDHVIRKLDLIRFRTGPPGGLGGYSDKFREITISWDVNPEPEVKGYIIYRSEFPEGPFIEVKRVSKRETNEVVDKGSRKNRLADGRKYYYKVKAYNEQNALSQYSEAISVIAKGGPSPPTLVAAGSGQIRKIPLTWQESVDKETKGYKLLRAESETGRYWEIADIKDRKTTSYLDKPDLKKNHELNDHQTYWYKLASYNGSGSLGNHTEPVSASTRRKPNPPANFEVTSASIRSVSLSWEQHPDSEITQYRVYRSSNPEGNFAIIKEINDQTITDFIDVDKSGKKIEDGTMYYYRLTAVNSGDSESDLTPTAGGETTGAPLPPTGIKTVSGLVRQVKITWTPSTDGNVTGYSIYRGKTADSLSRTKKIENPPAEDKEPPPKAKEFFLSIVNSVKKLGEPKSSSNTGSKENNESSGFAYIDKGSLFGRLKNGTVYFYAVKSFNEVDVESPASEVVRAETKHLPVTPRGLRGTTGRAGKIKLNWDRNPEPYIAHYNVFRSTSPTGEFKTLKPVEETTYEDSGLKNGTTYYYRIQALDIDELESSKTELVKVATKPIPTPPGGLVSMSDATSISINWKANPEPDIDHYEIYSVEFFKGKKLAGQSMEPVFTITGLKPDHAYTYSIVAVDNDGLKSRPSPSIKTRTLK